MADCAASRPALPAAPVPLPPPPPASATAEAFRSLQPRNYTIEEIRQFDGGNPGVPIFLLCRVWFPRLKVCGEGGGGEKFNQRS